MIKIIKNGDLSKTEVNFKCRHCGCEFVASGRDYTYIGSRTSKKYVIDCPDCGIKIMLVENSALVDDGTCPFDKK